ncbi:hypothetical protein NDU88_001664 [Pleurodeles waltl]|uniref:Uncharacterized protein n=1 Tax=Pleurodeles waltl TaxID=8319 RepID=A0AAV7SZZ6_PLEWA|nr:hypothetical protein NDU88_001664 [Pleurodeles waltl]
MTSEEKVRVEAPELLFMSPPKSNTPVQKWLKRAVAGLDTSESKPCERSCAVLYSDGRAEHHRGPVLPRRRCAAGGTCPGRAEAPTRRALNPSIFKEKPLSLSDKLHLVKTSSQCDRHTFTCFGPTANDGTLRCPLNRGFLTPASHAQSPPHASRPE